MKSNYQKGLSDAASVYDLHFPVSWGLFAFAFAFAGLTSTRKETSTMGRPVSSIFTQRPNPHVILHVVWAHLRTAELLDAWGTAGSSYSQQTHWHAV